MEWAYGIIMVYRHIYVTDIGRDAQLIDQCELYIYCCLTGLMLVAIPLSSYLFDT